MMLSSFSYHEFRDSDREWCLSPTTFGPVTLIVGKNSAGKTRLLNVLHGLSMLMSGRIDAAYSSGTYEAAFINGAEILKYQVELKDQAVIHEVLRVGRSVRLNRDEKKGVNSIYMASLSSKGLIDFEIPRNKLAVSAKRDKKQHPFLEILGEWADGVELQRFNSLPGGFIQGVVLGVSPDFQPENLLRQGAPGREAIALVILAAIAKSESKFKEGVVADMTAIGYPITDVGVGVSSVARMSPPPLAAWVKESDLRSTTEHSSMSNGMFRAFATIVRLNVIKIADVPTLLLIDDVGEGMDYVRSVKLISLIFDHAKKSKLQTIMTSNDRFVMNAVPLRHWGVVLRDGHNVNILNYQNSKQEMDGFERLGLNNFDYFASKHN